MPVQRLERERQRERERERESRSCLVETSLFTLILSIKSSVYFCNVPMTEQIFLAHRNVEIENIIIMFCLTVHCEIREEQCSVDQV